MLSETQYSNIAVPRYSIPIHPPLGEPVGYCAVEKAFPLSGN
jgi:hypothetical protein